MINSDYQAKYIAHELERVYANDDVAKLSGLMFDAQIIPTPHQIDAALFALNSPARGIILADEVGLGKTIEAGIVIMQYYSERKRKILIIAPSSLRQQWAQELQEKFIPGVSFHFLYEELIQAPGYMFDGYHVAKIKDMLNLFSELYICIIPTHNKSQFENIIPSRLLDRVYYLDHDGEGLEEWTKKVYRIVLKQSGKG